MTTARATRSDAMPEAVVYRDTGCEVSPSCLACPLARCVLDVPLVVQRREARNAAIRAEYARGASVDALAARYGLSRRSVFRALHEGRAR